MGRLLLRHACKTHARVRLVEWPGCEPVTLVFQVGSTAELGRKTLDTEGRLTEEEAAAVPWGSHGILRLENCAREHVLLGQPPAGRYSGIGRNARRSGISARASESSSAEE